MVISRVGKYQEIVSDVERRQKVEQYTSEKLPAPLSEQTTPLLLVLPVQERKSVIQIAISTKCNIKVVEIAKYRCFSRCKSK
jgi:hypothetical protein